MRVGKFVHDEQGEFGKFMHKWFPVLRSLDSGSTSALAFMGDLRGIDIIRCDIELARSADTPGLQLIDTVFWLYRRSSIKGGFRGLPECSKLIEFIVERATVDEFSEAQLTRDAEQMFNELQSAPLSEQAMARGRAVTAALEESRLRRMGPDLRH
jgi:hypothetical protein